MSYEKQTWNKYDDLKTEEENIENGAVVTDNRMNHIEEGIYSHTNDTSNPHKVTAAQVGLGNVQNFGLATEDEAKQAISNAKYMTPSLTQAVLSANINSIAYANSADGTDGFTTVYPNLNLLDGTKDFSGDWWLVERCENDGTYKGLTVKKGEGPGITKQFIVPKDGVYTFSAYVKSSGDSADIHRHVTLNTVSGKAVPIKPMGNNFDWLRDSFQVTLKEGDKIYAQYNVYGSGVLWNAGHKWEEGSTATPYIQSASEVTTADWPKFVGFSNTVKTNKSASDYTWFPVKDSELTNKVESHINNKANPHAVTASQVGAYSKSESDSKLTALENKSISNKGNLKKGDDLNDITATGFYRIGGFVGGTEILNVPTELSGVEFYAFVTVTEAIQELTVYAPINSTTWTYSRSISGTKPTWSSWSKTVMADDSGKVKLTDFEVTTISETVNIGNGLSLNFQRKGEFVLVRFSGSLTAINSGTYFSTAVPEQWRPDGIKELIGHFASGALAFHVDLETDGRVKWWGASGATGAARGTAMYFLK